MEGFPILTQINNMRRNCYKESHKTDLPVGPSQPNATDQPGTPVQTSKTKKPANWIGHKALSAVAIPTNLLGMGVGAVGAVASGCTLGALKVLVFAATVGNVRLLFPSGFLWFAEGSLHSVKHLGLNTGELISDGARVVKEVSVKTYKGTRWVMKTLYIEKAAKIIFQHLNKILKAIGKKILPALKFIGKKVAFVANKVAIGIEKVLIFMGQRMAKGWKKAIEAEKGFEFEYKTPAFLNFINEPTKKNRINFESENRLWKNIFKHTFLSGPNIILNGSTAVASSLVLAPLALAFTAKAMLYASTNINIPVPTFVSKVFQSTVYPAGNVVVDIDNDIADSAAVVFKTSKALGILKVMTTALDVIKYIPKAVFS